MHSKKVYSDVLPDGSLLLKHKESGETLTKLKLVPANKDHRSFILSTWVKSYSPTVRRQRTMVLDGVSHIIHHSTYLAEEPKCAERLWEKSKVLTDPEDPYVIHGWVCGEEGKLWHCYVPPLLRSKGMAMAMIGHVCGLNLEYARPWPYREVPFTWKYNPYLLGFGQK